MRKVSTTLKVSILLLMAVCLMVSSCKKDEGGNGGSGTTPAKSNGEGGPKMVQKGSGGGENEMVPLPFELPKPMFEGTPQNINVPNLEKPLGKPRPPYYAPKSCVNLAAKKPVTSTDDEPIIGEIEFITDGDKAASDGSYVELGPGKQQVTVDLGQPSEIWAVLFWHYHKQARVYFDVVVQVADDPDFITNVRTLFNNDNDNSSGQGVGKDKHYVETSEGRLVTPEKAEVAQYVRLSSKGSNANDLNHYIEVEVWGRPAQK